MNFFKPKYTCKAAKHSLLFQPSGEILSCHYNRGYILGNYPNNSIDEVWSGKKRKALLKSIDKGKFDKGCFSCKKAIESNLTHAAGFYKYDYIEGDNSGNPISMEFQLDNICNLECIMCSGEYSNQIRKNREKGAPYISPYDDKFISQLEKYIPNLKYAAFTGGEPFLFEIYYKIWDKIKLLNPGLNIYISTNGTILDDKVKSYLNSLNFNLTISIDTLNKQNYEKIRKNANLEKTIANIEYFNQYLKLNNRFLNIKCLVTPQNYKDIPDLLEYCNINEINLIPKIVILPAFASIETCSLEELNQIHKTIEASITDSSKNIIRQNNSRFEEIQSQISIVINNKTNDKTRPPESLSLEELKILLTDIIISESKNTLDDIKQIKNKCEILLSSIENTEELRTAIIGFLKVAPELLVAEFNRTEINKLVERFKQSSKEILKDY